MNLTKEEALRAYTKMMNTFDIAPLELLLADDFVYVSQMVLTPIESKKKFMEYIKPKLITIKEAGATVYAELGRVNAYGEDQPCVILAQNHKEELVGIVLVRFEDGRLIHLILCIVPPPQAAIRSGEYPV